MHAAIGIIELSSIAAGFKVQDAMIKAAEVEVAIARSICPGKYLIVLGGKVANVSSSLEVGRRLAAGFLVDTLYLAHIDQRVLPALSGCVAVPENPRALGIIETFSAASCIEAADAAIKAAQVTLLRVHAAMAIGGKGFLLLSGDVTAVQTAVEAGCQRIKENATLVNREVISGASRELFQEYL
ncbi:BMC domain-containing protein [Desulfobulbus rhabdoformis]|uniref:BMC domain-containing protein n=1 Tax=Desulfobulbus rhabdoformis TaxID=34032 RepID=UPI0019625CC6|nr:BMC domain-containing protein [Desulfobulbus rhabdoformis]MBM9615108.1 BMC domain-containing protein [Desulfobulbus rhabdoformis]